MILSVFPSFVFFFFILFFIFIPPFFCFFSITFSLSYFILDNYNPTYTWTNKNCSKYPLRLALFYSLYSETESRHYWLPVKQFLALHPPLVLIKTTVFFVFPVDLSRIPNFSFFLHCSGFSWFQRTPYQLGLKLFFFPSHFFLIVWKFPNFRLPYWVWEFLNFFVLGRRF